ncbi:MAG: YraN family protein [Bacteroidales bacterium]|nr:YraN family protein [Bacteroidales bacterium]
MTEHLETGMQGEEMACSYLKGLGYKILERNWQFGKNEIDIVALDGEILVIAEVKTRNSAYFMAAEAAVTKQKQRLLIRAANVYVQKKNFSAEIRFDIISVYPQSKGEKISHIKDAFYPLL